MREALAEAEGNLETLNPNLDNEDSARALAGREDAQLAAQEAEIRALRNQLAGLQVKNPRVRVLLKIIKIPGKRAVRSG